MADLENSIISLKKSESELQKLTAHLYHLQEEERLKISREIHDVLGQSLTVLRMDLSTINLEYGSKDKALSEKLLKSTESIDDILKSVGKIVSNLGPSLLEYLGLMAAVEVWLQDFQKKTGLNCQLTSNLENVFLSKEISIAFFRVLQEALTNTLCHSGSKQAELSLKKIDGHLVMKIKDFGKGLPTINFQNLGIIGMRERIHNLGGSFSIESSPGKGVVIYASAPLKEQIEK